jgi:hypothetical protein
MVLATRRSGPLDAEGFRIRRSRLVWGVKLMSTLSLLEQ